MKEFLLSLIMLLLSNIRNGSSNICWKRSWQVGIEAEVTSVSLTSSVKTNMPENEWPIDDENGADDVARLELFLDSTLLSTRR